MILWQLWWSTSMIDESILLKIYVKNVVSWYIEESLFYILIRVQRVAKCSTSLNPHPLSIDRKMNLLNFGFYHEDKKLKVLNFQKSKSFQVYIKKGLETIIVNLT